MAEPEEVIREERPRMQHPQMRIPGMMFSGIPAFTAAAPQMMSMPGLQVLSQTQPNMLFPPDLTPDEMMKQHPLGFNAAIICRLMKVPLNADTLQLINDELISLARSTARGFTGTENMIEYEFRYTDCVCKIKLTNFTWSEYWSDIVEDFKAWWYETMERNTTEVVPSLSTIVSTK
jgi:hypothetical protein